MARLDRQELQKLARLGATARLAELERERVAILRAFPDLRAGMAAQVGGVDGPGNNRRRKLRRQISAAQRRAISSRMKEYWAERRRVEKTLAKR